MRKIITMALAAVTAGACALVSFAPDADARRGGGGGFHGGGFHASFARASSFHAAPAFRAGPVFRSAPVVHRATVVHRPAYAYRRVYAAPIYVSSYGNGCAWLHRRAIATGSPYWWDRYNRCIRGW